MTLFNRVTEVCRERYPSIRVARITIDSIHDLDRMLQPGIRFGVTVRNTSELIGTPIAQIEYFYFSVDVMDGDERMIIQRMETWRNGTYKAFYRIFYDEVCQTRLDGLDGVELGWRDAHTHEHLRNVYRLLYFGGEPPMEDVITGEQYYDTVEDKIHTAINTEVGGEFLVWDIGGVAPKDNTLYVSESDYTYNTCRLWLYKEGYMRSLGIVQPQMDNAIFLSKNDEVMVTYNTSEQKADIIIGNRVKNRFMVIVPSTTSGIIAINTIFNNIVPFGFLAEYEIYVYIESNDVTATTLATSCSGISGYTSGLMVGTLQASDISGKGLHKLTYIRDRATADTHMSLYVKHEYFEKV